MIHENELRIGNIVTDEFWESFRTKIEVDSINSKGINLSIEDDGNWSELAQHFIEPEYSFEELHGIPLTPEILGSIPYLRKNTFDSHIWYVGREDSQFHVYYREDLDRFVFRGLGMSIVYVDTLHHLQNLVFVNTGKELIVNI